MDIVLVNMPLVGIARPSLGLGLLKALLKERGLDVLVINAHLHFAEQIGLNSYRTLVRNYSRFLGEWIFTRAAFPSENEISATEDYHRWLQSNFDGASTNERNLDKASLSSFREAACKFVEALALEVCDINPRIVGCSSVFQQHVASLALLRHVRLFDPTIVTLLGGANCESVMGEATKRVAPWVDYIVSGEADDVIVQLCEAILDSREPPNLAAAGIIARVEQTRQAGPQVRTVRATCRNIDRLPPPDFDEYFDDLSRSPLKQNIHPAILSETSRGCWWGETKHCTFCGLNGEQMLFRTKAPARILSEFSHLTKTYGVRRIGLVDNIFAHKWFETLLPRLEEQSDKPELFYEIKTNLTRKQVAQLRRAGVLSIQPGIESLSTELLRLMGKGSLTTHAIQLLKWCSEYGVQARWSILHGFPTESDACYAEVANWLPAIFHLEPPLGVFPVEFHRFSVYHDKAEEFALRLRPHSAYAHVYPFDSETLTDIAYMFEADGRVRERSPNVERLRKLTIQWREEFDYNRQALVMHDDMDKITIDDKRICRTASTHVLTDLDAVVYRMSDAAPPRWQLIASAVREANCDPSKVEQAIAALETAGLVLSMDDRLIGLAVRPGRAYKYKGDYDPYGSVDWTDTVDRSMREAN
ncbi:RiPP maturation radical SAM C-methyltransferase [Bradyrhizobium barranii]|uniref:RiPP maturation radical SAM C-methyltransferase n=1 Tax=Bradyrhizobium TaxID=374 RepID=UPI003F1FA201